jgi:acyl carrier protein
VTKDDIKNTVKSYILREFLPGESPDNLSFSTQLITSGVLDSLATLKLVAFLEESYGISVQPHELEGDNLDTIDRITEFVGSKLG